MKKHLIKKLKYFGLIVAFMLPSFVQGAGIELYGRVYVADQKYRSINDADLVIFVCQREPDLEYPIDNGKYKALDFGIEPSKVITIDAYHPSYMLKRSISFQTTQWKVKRDVRMKMKSVVAEENYRKATSASLRYSKSFDDVVESVILIQEAINLSPKSRYYKFQADNIGRWIKNKPESESIPVQLIDFARDTPKSENFRKLTIDDKYEFFLKLGAAFSKAENINEIVYGARTYLQLSLESYDRAIKIKPKDAEAYQAKYLLLGKSNLYLDATNTIKDFFVVNDPVKSELTIKGFLVDWISFVKALSNYKGRDDELENIRKIKELYDLWADLGQKLEQYKNYYKNEEIKGNKNLREAYEIALKILQK